MEVLEIFKGVIIISVIAQQTIVEVTGAFKGVFVMLVC